MTTLLRAATIATAGLTAVAAALSVAGARRAVRRRPKRRHRVIRVGDGTVTLEATQATTAPGQYRILFGPADAASALVGEVVDQDEDTVTRALVHTADSLPSVGDSVLWTGYVFLGPDAINAPAADIVVDAPSGPRAAWLFTPSHSSSIWAIHIHGIHSSRRSALRGVPSTLSAGMPSLVVSYRGDAEDSAAPPATLGQSEAHDVDAALQYAIDHGATQLVLVGWSMGATISLLLATRSQHRARIKGLILVGPALNWTDIIRAATRRSGLPGFLAPLFVTALALPGLAHLSGLKRPLRRLDLRPSLEAVGAPVLILHSDGDTDAPIAASEHLARTSPDQVTLETFDPVPHGMEWNSDPDRFASSVRGFLETLP